MAAFSATTPVLPARAAASMAGKQLCSSVSNGSKTVAKLSWLPGGMGKMNPAYLDGSLLGCAARAHAAQHAVTTPGSCWQCCTWRSRADTRGVRVLLARLGLQLNG